MVLAASIAACMPLFANPAAGPESKGLLAGDGPAEIRIGLLTLGPAGTIMSQYGHAAIVVFDGRGRSELYELATESPSHRYRVPWYLSSQDLIYRSHGASLSTTLHSAFLEFRDVQLRVLNLTDAQQSRLATQIARGLAPDRAHFEFGVYTQNCSTRIRDLLDQALDGQLRRYLLASPAAMSFREHSLRAFVSRPWTAISLDFALGRLSDRTPTRWDESFFPETLARALDDMQVATDSGGVRPLVASVSDILTGKPAFRMPPRPPDFRFGLAAGGASLWALLALALRRAWPAAGRIERAVLAIFGALGVFLLYLWFVGGERVASWNENLLVYNPLLLGLAWVRAGRVRDSIAVAILAGLALAVLLKCLPFAQANLGWMLFAGPAIASLALRSLAASTGFFFGVRRLATSVPAEPVRG